MRRPLRWALAWAVLFTLSAGAARAAVDLNRADADDLAAVPWMGETFAHTLLEDRAARGPFRSVDDLLRVPGVTTDLVDRWRPWIEVGTPVPGLEWKSRAECSRRSGGAWMAGRREVQARLPLTSGAEISVLERVGPASSLLRLVARGRSGSLAVWRGTRAAQSVALGPGPAPAALLDAVAGQGRARAGCELSGDGTRTRWRAAVALPVHEAEPAGHEDAAADSLMDHGAEDPGPEDVPGPAAATLAGVRAAGVPGRLAGGAAVVFGRVGGPRLRFAAAGEVRRPQGDCAWSVGWLDGAPRWAVEVRSGAPEGNWLWRTSVDGRVYGATPPAGGRLARLRVAVQRIGVAWSLAGDASMETRAPSSAALHARARSTFRAEATRAAADDPAALILRASLAARDDPDDGRGWPTEHSLRVTALVHPDGALHPFSLAATCTAAEAMAWCAGWRVSWRRRRIRRAEADFDVRFHAVAHGGRSSASPTWPLLTAAGRPAGGGVDFLVEVARHDRSGGGALVVAHGTTVAGERRWWASLRLGGDGRGGRAVL